MQPELLRTDGISLRRDEHGMLWLERADEKPRRIKLRRTFPLSDEGRMISVRDSSDPDEKELGCIADLRELDEKSREAAEAELRVRYFVPRIQRILALEELFGFLYFSVDTDRGARTFVVKDPGAALTRIGDDGILMLDAEECRYLVPSTRALDRKSRELLADNVFLAI